MIHIADSSLFIIGKRIEGNIITVPSVVEELRNENIPDYNGIDECKDRAPTSKFHP